MLRRGLWIALSLWALACGSDAATSDADGTDASASGAPTCTTSPGTRAVAALRLMTPFTDTRPPRSICFRVRPDAARKRWARQPPSETGADTV